MGLPKDDLPQINRGRDMNTRGAGPDLNPESLDPRDAKSAERLA